MTSLENDHSHPTCYLQIWMRHQPQLLHPSALHQCQLLMTLAQVSGFAFAIS
jgi:hypothetical protein